ncbi:hypothetical protein SAMN04488066_12053 [Halorubrum aquaticum]|uniref:Uncharacterized protein n=1 Tax=Halorubrum aquaticum TaxID=387340 RepID=A0A1I3CA08_9EURY|nr:hypothetical protein [Halorubrum aquaticum]SFH71253.1 hypothetical protein SAMN04488066_12053 [Halorubrum aquaticum]
MDRAVPFATAFLVGVCVFAWLAGPVLEARFGTEALVLAYAGVAVGAAGTTYVLVRRLDARLGGGTSVARGGGGANDVDAEGDSAAAAENTRDGGENAGRAAGGSGGNGGDRAGDTVTVSLDELEALDVEREVRELKAERESGGDESD